MPLAPFTACLPVVKLSAKTGNPRGCCFCPDAYTFEVAVWPIVRNADGTTSRMMADPDRQTHTVTAATPDELQERVTALGARRPLW